MCPCFSVQRMLLQENREKVPFTRKVQSVDVHATRRHMFKAVTLTGREGPRCVACAQSASGGQLAVSDGLHAGPWCPMGKRLLSLNSSAGRLSVRRFGEKGRTLSKLAGPLVFVALMFLGGALNLSGGPAYGAQAQANQAQTSGSAGMYGTYVDKRVRFFSDSLGRAYPIEMENLLPELMHAVGRLSDYPVPATLPAVYRVPHEKIEEIACGRKCPALGAYRRGDGVYLDDSLQPETNVFARSVLLHELVHYVQDLSAVTEHHESCDHWYRREKEAYAIQEYFLSLVGSEHRVSYSTLFGYSALLDCQGIAAGEVKEVPVERGAQ